MSLPGVAAREGERALLEQGMTALGELLGHLEVRDYRIGVPDTATVTGPSDDRGVDKLVNIGDPASGMFSGPVLVEASRRVTPAMLKERLRPQVEFMRRLTPDATVLVISAWISPRSRELLNQWDYGYLDLTGNVSFRLDRPVVRLRLDGASKDPEPVRQEGPRQLRGTRAGRLVRALVDVMPPYTASELAAATELSLPYISRLLQGLQEQGLITRRNKLVQDVDWVGLLRARADETVLLKDNRVTGRYVAPRGIPATLEQLRPFVAKAETDNQMFAVTGPIAAAAVAPLTIGGQLILYVAPGEQSPQLLLRNLHRSLGLLPQPEGAQVLLLAADDPVLFTGLRIVDGLPHVALSQLAIDNLSGPGRGPAEGEALIEHMSRDQKWRLASLDQWRLGHA